jgi:hypothetical protein
MDPLTIIAVINGLIAAAGNIAVTIAKLKAVAAENGATDEQLADLDVRLTAALAAREAEQS